MIEFRIGDLLATKVEALVNTVNCVGVMGRGVALQFKDAFPENFKAFKAACDREEVQPGRMFVFETGFLANPKYIINFPTKRHWRGKSRIEDIDAGLRALVEVVRERGITSIALPPLGSGLGGLPWADVRPRIDAAFHDLPHVQVIVFEPHAATEPEVQQRAGRVPTMTEGRAALIGLMQRYLGGLLDPFVTLLEVHKLMYFMQAAGEPLRLRYVAGPHGPYAENLRHVLREIEGYYVSCYANTGDEPERELMLVPGAVDDAETVLARHPATRARFERVGQVVQGFETPFGLELLTTVHWVATQSRVETVEDVLQGVYGWNERKRRFLPQQIQLALKILAEQGWLSADHPVVSG
jgi:O-acetyl-ADP-ribose deacetylase (regulator of RNase III)